MLDRHDPATLRAYGEALYGPQWQSALARDLEVSDRTMRRWAASDSAPSAAMAKLQHLVAERRALLQSLLAG